MTGYAPLGGDWDLEFHLTQNRSYTITQPSFFKKINGIPLQIEHLSDGGNAIYKKGGDQYY